MSSDNNCNTDAVSSNYLCTRTADARHCKYTYLQHSMARWLLFGMCVYIYIFFLLSFSFINAVVCVVTRRERGGYIEVLMKNALLSLQHHCRSSSAASCSSSSSSSHLLRMLLLGCERERNRGVIDRFV